MNINRIWTVARKELRDSFRDRRQVIGMLVGTLMTPLLMGFVFNRIAEDRRGADQIQVPVVGREHAPVLIDWLEQQSGIKVVPGPADAEAAVRDRKEELVVVIPKDFSERFRESLPAKVKLVSDFTATKGRFKVERVRSLLQRYGAEIGSLRLLSRGVAPSIATAVAVENVEVSSAQQRAAMLLNMIPLFVMMSAFMAGMAIATDATAGERERGSFEPLLVNPVPRLDLVAGKWLAGVVSAAGGMVITFSLVTAMLLRVPLQDLGMRFRFGPPEALLMLLALLPLTLLGPAMQMYLSTFARSFKEAQGYVSYLILMVTMPALLNTFFPLTGKPWMAAIPVLSQFSLSLEVVGGKTPPAWQFVLATISAMAAAAVCLHLTRKLFERETIIFNR